jgi:hypothetical protein
MSRADVWTSSPAAATLPVVELELVPVRMHAVDGDDRGAAELPVGWLLEVGDVLVDKDGRLVRVLELIDVEQPARIAALVRVGRV